MDARAKISVLRFREIVCSKKDLPYNDILIAVGQLVLFDARYFVDFSHFEGNSSASVSLHSKILNGARSVITIYRRSAGDYYLLISPHWLDALDLRSEQMN